MKKQLALTLGLAVLAAPAFATKARLQSLGEDQYGSYYVQDNRNIFLNPAQVNNYKDMVTFELGNTKNDSDVEASPKAEGGVFYGHGNMVYGVYLGAESNSAAAFRSWAGINTDYAEENNVVDFFVAGDAGIKWGANLSYSSSAKNELAGDAEQQSMRLRLGVLSGNWGANAQINLANKAEQANGAQEFKGNTGVQVGGHYNHMDYTFFGEYRMLKGSDEVADADASVNQFFIGAGKNHKLNDKATLFTKISYNNIKGDNESATNLTFNGDVSAVTIAGGDIDTKVNAVPVVLGLEVDAASWLTLRASVSQTIIGNVEVDGNKRSLDNTTNVATGAGLKFGDLTIDGMLGTAGNRAAGNLNTDDLMARMAMSYKF